MKFTMKRILALLMATMLILSFTACSIDADKTIDDTKGQIGNVIDWTKDKLDDATDDIIQDIADTAKDKLDEWLDTETTDDNSNTSNAVTTIDDPKISITMLDVGQGLSILVESNGEYMLYDGGDRATSSYVVSYLKKHNVDHLKYMVASHYDSDHLAGLVGVFEIAAIDTVINPDFSADSKIYDSYIAKRDASGAAVDYPSVGDAYKLGYATITVLAPARNYGDANEMSVALKIQCDNFACIVTGDAEMESETDMLESGIDLGCDLYIVGHHGSSSSSTDAFVKAMMPAYGFISCGKGNDYGHPTDKTLATLAKYHVEIYRSDTDGVVTCESDGKNYAFSKELSQTTNNTENADDTSYEYVLNTNSMKFHHSECSAVKNMSEKNKEISTKTREELINEGYSPCGYCDP
jgi:beta-lactamase superfamily II metal-dependent hydrolase